MFTLKMYVIFRFLVAMVTVFVVTVPGRHYERDPPRHSGGGHTAGRDPVSHPVRRLQ